MLHTFAIYSPSLPHTTVRSITSRGIAHHCCGYAVLRNRASLGIKKSWPCRKKVLNRSECTLLTSFRDSKPVGAQVHWRSTVLPCSTLIEVRSGCRIRRRYLRARILFYWSRPEALLTCQKDVLVGSVQSKQSEEPLSQIQKEEIPRSFASRHYMAIHWSVSTRWSTRHKQIISAQ
jgi:hypothetical protein